MQVPALLKKSNFFRWSAQLKMSGKDSGEVTLALVDPSLLSSWEEMVKRGEECSLLLSHSRGRVTTMLQYTKPSPSSSLATASPSHSQAKRGRKTGETRRKGWSHSLLTINAWWTRKGFLQADSCCSMQLYLNGSSSGLHKLWYVLISWADRGSCAHKCVC